MLNAYSFMLSKAPKSLKGEIGNVWFKEGMYIR